MYFYAFQSESVTLALDEMLQVQTFPGINAESFIFFVTCLQAFTLCNRRLASLFMASYSTFFLLYDNQMS